MSDPRRYTFSYPVLALSVAALLSAGLSACTLGRPLRLISDGELRAGTGTFHSTEIGVTPGNYRTRVRLSCPAGHPEVNLHSLLTIALNIRSRDGRSTMKVLSHPLNLIRTEEFCSGAQHELIIAEGMYPTDAGWIEGGSATVSADVRVRSAELTVHSLELERTTWGDTARSRIAAAAVHPLIPIVPIPVFVSVADDTSTPHDTSGCYRLNKRSSILAEEIARYGLAAGACKSARAASLTIEVGAWECDSGQAREACQSARTSREGYHIRVSRSGVKIRALSEAGATYALDTLDQARKARLNVREVFDYPALEFRAAGGNDPARTGYVHERRAHSFLREGRFNVQFIDTSTHESNWWAPSDKVRALLQSLVAEARLRADLAPGIMINPYITENSGFSFEYSDDRTRHHFLSLLAAYRRDGVDTIMMRSDDFVPVTGVSPFSYGLTAPGDLRKFGSLGTLHARLVSDAANTLSLTPRPFRLLFVPPWYNWFFVGKEPALAETYAEQMRKTPSVAQVVWTGPSVRSLVLDNFSTRSFASQLGIDSPVLWDNTLFARRHKDLWLNKSERSSLLSFFEPYQVDGRWTQSHSGAFINAQFFERTRVQLVTAGAYLWNPAAYDPYRILWTYLVRRFGEDDARRLIDIDDTLWREHTRRLQGVPDDGNEMTRISELVSEMLSRSTGDNEALLRELAAKLPALAK